jgi:tetratricopeptide (TPR) repeat protein
MDLYGRTAVQPGDAESVRAVLEDEPGSVPALMASARLRRLRGDARGAAELLEDIVKEHPDFAPAVRDLAELYARDDARLRDAFELAARARDLLPDDARTAGLLGKLAYRRANYEWAADLLGQSLAREPGAAETTYLLGLCHHKLEQHQAATETLRRALRLQPDSPYADQARQVLAPNP